MGIDPHNRISTKHQKIRGHVPRSCRTIFNKWEGEWYIKRRVNHDCSLPGPSGLLVNNRIQRESLQSCFYGFCLLRILHTISEMRSICPTRRILIVKIDLDAAYHQIHANKTTASTWIVIVYKLSFLCLRLPFGTTSAPEEYTTVSESEIDLGNDLLRDESWDTYYLKSPHRYLIPQEDKQQSARHLPTEEPLAVDITVTEASMDGLIYDIITLTVDDKHWIGRSKSASLLIINTLFQPLQTSEHMKRDDPISLSKLTGEGQLANHRTCIGWDINTHYLMVSIWEKKKEPGPIT